MYLLLNWGFRSVTLEGSSGKALSTKAFPSPALNTAKPTMLNQTGKGQNALMLIPEDPMQLKHSLGGIISLSRSFLSLFVLEIYFSLLSLEKYST